MWSKAAEILNPYTQIKHNQTCYKSKQVESFNDLIHLLNRNKYKLNLDQIEQLISIIKEIVHEK